MLARLVGRRRVLAHDCTPDLLPERLGGLRPQHRRPETVRQAAEGDHESAKATAAGLADFADQFADRQAVELLDPPLRRVSNNLAYVDILARLRA